MDSERISRLRTAMNVTTQDFLNEFTPKLEKLFHSDLSSVYLESMNDHLQTFYNDVLQELDKKESTMSKKIAELLKEAFELKRKLNVDIDFDLEQEDDVPMMMYQNKLDTDLADMREKYAKKMAQIEDCLKQQEVLCEELNEEIRNLSVDPLATDSEIIDFESYLLDLKLEKEKRLNEIESLQREIHSLCADIGADVVDMGDLTFVPSKENIAYLQSVRDRYQKERKDVHHECDQLLQKLEVLWDCLDAPSSVRCQYRAIAAQHKISSIKDLNSELKSCKASKQENMKIFIEKMRTKLIEQWDKIYKSQDERDQFEFLRSDTYTDDMLQLHEMELEECTRFYNENKHIFELFISRNQWWSKKKALEAKQNEPNRYNNRGGQLLKEEKERKQTDIEIPKIEKRIKTFAEEFRRQNNRNFTINGVCIIELMDKEWECYRDSKELLKSARKAAPTPGKVAMTPKTPRGHVTLKRMASTTNLAMTAGNTAKKRHLEMLPSREVNKTASVQRINAASSYAVRSQTKRNLLSQYNDENVSGFTKPTGKSLLQKRMISSNTKPTTLANVSANKIKKKYRLSRKSHNILTSDESLVNYDAFESNIKTSQISNSSVVGHNKECEMVVKTTKHNNYRAKSPLKPSNLGPMETNNIIDIV